MGCHQAKASSQSAPRDPSTLLGRVGLRSDRDEKQANTQGEKPTSKFRRPRTRECEEAELQVLAKSVGEQLPAGPRICILGSTAFWKESTEPLVKALAHRTGLGTGVQSLKIGMAALSLSLRDSNAVVLTGGMPGVQEVLAKGLHNGGFQRVVNLVHLGHESGFSAGEDLAAGLDAAERRRVFASLGDVYLCIEGGAGVAEEAQTAFDNGAFILPIPSTGGASGGAFNFPKAALQRPRHVSPEEWTMLGTDGHPEVAATAIVKILCRYLQAEAQKSGELLQGASVNLDEATSEEGLSTLDDVVTAVPVDDAAEEEEGSLAQWAVCKRSVGQRPRTSSLMVSAMPLMETPAEQRRREEAAIRKELAEEFSPHQHYVGEHLDNEGTVDVKHCLYVGLSTMSKHDIG
eukprot:s531_g1.t1